MEMLRIDNLSFSYPNADKKALNNINLSINEGDFIVLCGESGCGKTTFLKMLKRELSPHGEKTGEIFYNGVAIKDIDNKTSACDIGYVLQNPDNQIVTDKVWHEIAFGLENMGEKSEVIRRRVGEMASYFGIESWFRKNTDELSGGQKQLLNLASIMVMQPKILILDEPTSQLDPIAAHDFINTLQKLNRELGLTIILSEHRLEEVFSLADKIILMENGEVLLYDTPYNIGSNLKNIKNNHRMLMGLPSSVRIYNALEIDDVCPLTVKEGKIFIKKHFKNNISFYKEEISNTTNDNVVIELKDVYFRYEKNLPDVMQEVNLKVNQGELFFILGGNGSGKTTTLNVISGISKAYKGKVFINGRKIESYKGNELYRNNIAFLPQNPQTVFIKETVYDDLMEMLELLGLSQDECIRKIDTVAKKLDINHLYKMHPYDLSGGEQQKCALAKMLLLEPKILLLDEPTKGLDGYSKSVLSDILKQLQNDNITVLIVSHDVEFAADNASRCALFFDSKIISIDSPQNFFSNNTFYTTAANRISRQFYDGAVTCDAVIEMCKLNEAIYE